MNASVFCELQDNSSHLINEISREIPFNYPARSDDSHARWIIMRPARLVLSKCRWFRCPDEVLHPEIQATERLVGPHAAKMQSEPKHP
jgi:hypothetical protein